MKKRNAESDVVCYVLLLDNHEIWREREIEREICSLPPRRPMPRPRPQPAPRPKAGPSLPSCLDLNCGSFHNKPLFASSSSSSLSPSSLLLFFFIFRDYFQFSRVSGFSEKVFIYLLQINTSHTHIEFCLLNDPLESRV